MTNKARNDVSVRNCMVELIGLISPVLHAHCREHLTPGRKLDQYSNAVSYPPRVWEIAQQAWALAPDKFLDPSEAVEIASELLGWHLVEKIPLDEIAEMLPFPRFPFEFEVPISAPISTLGLACDLGGERSLKLATKETTHGSKTSLSGRVQALSRRRVVDQVERDVKVIIALLSAADVASIIPRMQDPSVIEIRLGSDIGSSAMDPRTGVLAASTTIHVPDHIGSHEVPDISSERLARGDHGPIAQVLKKIRHVVTQEEPAALYASSLLHADAIATGNPSHSIMFSLISLEAALLDDERNDNGARLREAIVYRLGTSAESRDQLRKRVKKLYEVRSGYVHKGRAPSEPYRSRVDALELSRDVLRRELNDFVVP